MSGLEDRLSVEEFLSRPLVARLATSGPTVKRWKIRLRAWRGWRPAGHRRSWIRASV